MGKARKIIQGKSKVHIKNSGSDDRIEPTVLACSQTLLEKSAKPHRKNETTRKNNNAAMNENADIIDSYLENLECGSCRQKFESKMELKNHFAAHFVDKSYVCESCGEHIEKFSLFINHCMQHIIECEGESRKRKNNLEKWKNSIKCELCFVKFEDRECYMTHMKTEHGMKVINDNSERKTEPQIIIPAISGISIKKPQTDSGIKLNTILQTDFANKKSTKRQKREERKSPEHNDSDEADADDFNVYHNNFECGSCRQVFETKLEMKNHFSDHYVDESYICESCGEHISNFSQFYDHCTQHIITLYCWDCKRCCKSSEELEQHKLMHKLSCDLCYKKFDDYQDYMMHMEAEHSIKGLKCDVCNKFYKSNLLLQLHLNNAHRGQPWKCEICNKGFTVRRSMLYHLERHSLNKPHVCDVCGDAFNTSTYLKYHKMKHTGDYPFKCPLCSKGYARKVFLKQHMNSHLLCNSNLPFKCTLCEKGFDSKFKLSVHMKSHSDEREFKCDMCPRGFKFSSHLKRHKVSHLKGTIDGKKKSCTKCLKSFFTQNDLDAHTEIYHVPNSSSFFECINCSMHFELLHEFSNHVIKHIKELPLVCPMCPETFLLKAKLVSHIESHFPDHFPRPCTKCSVLIETESDVDTHVCAFPFSCDFCGEGFTSKRFMLLHVSTHTSEFTNFCQVCKKLFAKKTNYKKHLKRFHSDSQDVPGNNRIVEFVPTKAKPHGCELCGVGFRYPSILEKHLLKHVRDKEEEAIVKKIIGKPTHTQLL